MPQAYRQLWSDPALVRKIQQNTERYRKADAVVQLVNTQGTPLAGTKVNAELQRHEFLFGCNLFVLGQLKTAELNRKYESAFCRLHNFATLPFYWGDLEPEQGKPRFAEGSSYIWRRPPPDRLVKWCQAHGITPKGHALMYVKTVFMPKWLDPKDAQALKEAGHKHMAEIAERYAREIAIWDVINEEIPRAAHPEQWHAVPEDYAAWCFKEAGRLFPKNVRLLINDGTRQTHVTTDKCEQNVKALLDRGVRVEGIGIQFHAYGRAAMLSGKQYPPEQLYAVYDRLCRLGLPLYITEITIPGTGADGPELQGEIVANLYRLWFSVPTMAGVTWWNLGDGTAYGGENKALGGLLDENLDPKPAYWALDKLINDEWKTRVAGTTDAEGRFCFRGFRGTYDLTVQAAGATQRFQITLGEGTDPPKFVVERPDR